MSDPGKRKSTQEDGPNDFLFIVLTEEDRETLANLPSVKLTVACWKDAKSFQHGLKKKKVVIVSASEGDGYERAKSVALKCMRLCETLHIWEIDGLGTEEAPTLAAYDAKLGLETTLRQDQPWIAKEPVPEETEETAEDIALEQLAVDQVGSVDPVAFHGVLGRLTLGTQPNTESNALFVLMHLLAFFAGIIGRGAHIVIDTPVYLNIYVALVGITGKGRKGTAGRCAMAIWREIDEKFTDENIGGGLNSGAGLLYHLRDPSPKENNKGQPIDEGVADKRAVFLEEELAAALMQGHRENEPSLCYLREFFDGRRVIRSCTKDPTRVTEGHLVAVGHCNEDDVSAHVTDKDKGNGTVNRFVWLFGRRSKKVKNPRLSDSINKLRNEIEELKGAIQFGMQVGEVGLSPEAEKLWDTLYDELEETPAGRLGAMHDRAPVIVRKIAALFAIAARKRNAEVEHLHASLAIWRHAEKSLRWIFRSDVDPDSEALLNAIKAAPGKRLSRTQVNELFSHNKSAKSLTDMLQRLLTNGTLTAVKITSKRGRPTTYFQRSAF